MHPFLEFPKRGEMQMIVTFTAPVVVLVVLGSTDIFVCIGFNPYKLLDVERAALVADKNLLVILNQKTVLGQPMGNYYKTFNLDCVDRQIEVFSGLAV